MLDVATCAACIAYGRNHRTLRPPFDVYKAIAHTAEKLKADMQPSPAQSKFNREACVPFIHAEDMAASLIAWANNVERLQRGSVTRFSTLLGRQRD